MGWGESAHGDGGEPGVSTSLTGTTRLPLGWSTGILRVISVTALVADAALPAASLDTSKSVRPNMRRSVVVLPLPLGPSTMMVTLDTSTRGGAMYQHDVHKAAPRMGTMAT